MSNKQRNIVAVCIHRPVATRQVRPGRHANEFPETEAAIITIIRALFGEDLFPPCDPATLWHAPGRRAA